MLLSFAILRFLQYFRKWRLLNKIPKLIIVPYHWFLGLIPTFGEVDERSLWCGIRKVEACHQKRKSWDHRFPSVVSIFHSWHISTIIKELKANIVYNLFKPWLGEE